MIAEIICVGSELLLGETINTNASYISKRLSNLGIDCYYQSTVGDNSERIKSVIDTAVNRSDLLIFTGGLGPTDDDITVQAIADYFNEELVLDEDSLEKIKNFFVSLNRDMPNSNIKQALRPKSAKVIPNSAGTAPGFILEIFKYNSKKYILTFPGVPEELYSMWDKTAHNYLRQFSSEVLVTRHLKYFGIAEATLADKVKDLMENCNPTVAPLVGRGEARLRVAAKSDSFENANNLIDSIEKIILERTHEYFYGYDDETLEEIVGELLLENDLTVGIAESCTGGLISSRLTDVPGSSNYIQFNMTTYSNESKIKELGINQNVIENYGAVSDKTAISMAEGIRGKVKSDIGLGITGIAGPSGGTELKPVGLVYIGLCNKYELEVHEVRIPSCLPRAEIKFRASQNALNYLRLFIKKHYSKQI